MHCITEKIPGSDGENLLLHVPSVLPESLHRKRLIFHSAIGFDIYVYFTPIRSNMYCTKL